MSHIFDPKMFKKLESPERKKALPVHEIIRKMALSKEMKIADIGCGIGYFSIPFSENVSEVHAIDISDIMITELNERTQALTNLSTHLGDFNTILSQSSMDICFTSTVIHELKDLNVFTKQAIGKLTEGGRMIHIDFEKKDTGYGPPVDKRIASSDVEKLFKKLGLKDIVIHDINHVFYMICGTK